MRKIYIVEGNTGEYSDRTNWMVKAFLKQESAERFRDKLDNKLKELNFDNLNYDESGKASEEMRELDPEFKDYGSSHYVLLTVDLCELDVFEELGD